MPNIDELKALPPLCAQTKRLCNPAAHFCACWWFSDNQTDWSRRHEEAKAGKCQADGE